MKDQFRSAFLMTGDIKENAEKIRLILLALFGVLLPFDMFYTTFILYLIVLTMLVDFNVRKIKTIPKQIWVFMLIFLIGALWYPLSSDTWRAGYLLERQLAIIIFPVLIPLTAVINKERLHFILWCFSFSCIYAVCFLLSNCLNIIISTGLPFRYLLTSSFFNHNFTAGIGIHAGYLSLYVSLSLFFLLYQFFQVSKIAGKILLLFGMGILSVGLFFMASRSAIIATILGILLVFPVFYVHNKLRFFALTGIVLILCIIGASQSSYIRSRFSSELAGDISINHHYTLEDPEPRIARWECAFYLIKSQPLMGYGTGDEIGLLKEQYLKKKMMVSYREEFNTHNQYIAYLLKHGIIGLFIFLIMLGYFFRLAIKEKDFLYFIFLFVLSIGFFTENIIDANKGIFYFAFFNTLFGYNILNARKRKSLEQQIKTITQE